MNVHILASCHRKDYVLRFSISVFLSAKKTRTEMRMKENEREKKRETERESGRRIEKGERREGETKKAKG